MNIVCRSCGKALAASDLNMEKLVARCKTCDTVFDFSDQVETVGTRRGRPPVAMPRAIALFDGGSALALPAPDGSYRTSAASASTPLAQFEITRRWYSTRYIYLAFFCIAWDSFLVSWYSHASKGGWIVVVFPILHVAVGLGLTYTTLAGFLNRTKIAVSNGTMKVTHGPIPWPGNETLETSDIEQLYCRQHVSRSRSSDAPPAITYELMLKTKSGALVKLLSGLPEAEQALFIEQAIETRLGIVDVEVAGELPR